VLGCCSLRRFFGQVSAKDSESLSMASRISKI